MMTGAKLSAGIVQPGLIVEHREVSADGRSVGLAVSLGSSFLFYTTDDRLQEFDGIRFDSIAQLNATVLAAVHEASGPGLAA